MKELQEVLWWEIEGMSEKNGGDGGEWRENESHYFI
jgi:hypothetical protein